MMAFIPDMLAGYLSLRNAFIYHDLQMLSGNDSVWTGLIIGTVIGLILHELAHAIAAISFDGKVMEFGVTYNGAPAAYTLIDMKTINSRIGLIITDLIGIQMNLMLAAAFTCISVNVSNHNETFFMIAVANAELAIVNLLLVGGFDGMNAMEHIIGREDILDNSKQAIMDFRYNSSRFVVTETEKAEAGMSCFVAMTKIIYPILIIFNIAIFTGW